MTAVRRALLRLVSLLPVLVTAAALAWTLAYSPFARPFVDRSLEGATRWIGIQMAAEVSSAWVETELAAALEAGDLDRALLVRDLAGRFDRPVPEDLAARLADLEEAATGWWVIATTCGSCMFDIAACPRLDLIAACSVPFELSPAGDLNALRRAGTDWVAGGEVDRLDAGLALVGLGASALVVASGGSSLTLKAGAGILRLGRRLGTLQPRFVAELARLSDVGRGPGRIGPDLAGGAPVGEIADIARLERLGVVAGDIGTVARRTSVADAAALLRHVDSAEDAARLARAAEALGPSTRGTFELLGKGRVFRALVRLSDLALTAAALIYALALQIAVIAAERLGRATLRAVGDLARGA